MFYYLDTQNFDGTTQRHIIRILDDGGVSGFILTDDNTHRFAYDIWLAEGNEPEEWTNGN